MSEPTAASGLTYIIPAYNEGAELRATVVRLLDVLATLDMPYEVLVIDDGSQQPCAPTLTGLSHVRVLRHPSNLGYGSALKTGIAGAAHDWIGIVDADGTYEIERLPELIAKMRDGFHMAIALRENTTDHDGPIKRLFRWIYIKVIWLLIGREVPDPNSGFRIFHREVALMFFPFLCGAFSFTTSITLFAMGQGYFVSYVPMPYRKRVGKSKVRHIRDSMRTAQLIIQGISFFNPIKFYLILALAFLAFFALPAIMLVWTGHPAAAPYLLTVGVVLVLLAGIGLLCDTLRIAILHKSHVDPEGRATLLKGYKSAD